MRADITVTGTFAFNSQSDQTFSSNDVMTLNLGDPNNPLSFVITPELPGPEVAPMARSVERRASLPRQREKEIVSARFNSAKNTFAISVQGFDFPSPGLTNDQIQVGVSIGSNYGSDLRPWVETSPHTFVPPPPLVTGQPVRRDGNAAGATGKRCCRRCRERVFFSSKGETMKRLQVALVIVLGAVCGRSSGRVCQGQGFRGQGW